LDVADSRHPREAEVMDFLLLTCHKNSQLFRNGRGFRRMLLNSWAAPKDIFMRLQMKIHNI
jgi:hypothetical protein